MIWKFQGYEAAFPCLRESGSHLLGLHGLSIASWMVRKQLWSFSHNWSVKCLNVAQAGSVAKPGGGRSGRVALGLQDKTRILQLSNMQSGCILNAQLHKCTTLNLQRYPKPFRAQQKLRERKQHWRRAQNTKHCWSRLEVQSAWITDCRSSITCILTKEEWRTILSSQMKDKISEPSL